MRLLFLFNNWNQCKNLENLIFTHGKTPDTIGLEEGILQEERSQVENPV